MIDSSSVTHSKRQQYAPIFLSLYSELSATRSILKCLTNSDLLYESQMFGNFGARHMELFFLQIVTHPFLATNSVIRLRQMFVYYCRVFAWKNSYSSLLCIDNSEHFIKNFIFSFENFCSFKNKAVKLLLKNDVRDPRLFPTCIYALRNFDLIITALGDFFLTV